MSRCMHGAELHGRSPWHAQGSSLVSKLAFKCCETVYKWIKTTCCLLKAMKSSGRVQDTPRRRTINASNHGRLLIIY